MAILAIIDDDEVVLARQFRPGPGRVLLELPSGGVDPGEDVLTAAKRELLEEIGYTGEIEFAGSSWLASAARTRRHVAVGRNAQARRAADLGYLALDHLGLLA